MNTVLKLITLNMEMDKHYDRVLPFLEEEKPDVVCLQEAPEEFQNELQKRGFQTSFAPMCRFMFGTKSVTVGVLIATKHPHTSNSLYYYRAAPEILLSYPLVGPERRGQKETRSFPCLIAHIETEAGTFIIGTTHAPVTGSGDADPFQTQCVNNLISILHETEPHILCGDFNMPRGYNALYKKIIEHYTDTIPKEFTSSLDRNIHKAGQVNLDVPIFDVYMVDYIFSQPPYTVSDVRFKFGVSDHAGVIAHIFKE